MSASASSTAGAAGAASVAADVYANMRAISPVRMRAPVVKGFGRGGKELGVPTANLDCGSLRGDGRVDEAAGGGEALLAGIEAGIYYGWASVGASSDVHKMVMSIGWNPFYKNEKKTAEPHLLHTFPEDFYGQEIRLVVCGYLRPETSFPSLDALIAAIQTDIRLTKERLEGEEGEARKNDPFLKPQ